jgi:S-adenosylmethionine:tRNA ribosyltransferase-isomerase
MDVSDFDFPLPPELIAQEPLAERDASRLLLLARTGGAVGHGLVRDLPSLLERGDLLVVNDARVIPARLFGKKRGTGGKVELLLIEPFAQTGRAVADVRASDWLALGQASKALKPGNVVEVGDVPVVIVEPLGCGELRVRFPEELADVDALHAFLERAGSLPLPPYIERPAGDADKERYQTLFAKVPGAIAAPTAGLHFTQDLLSRLDARGVAHASVTLHVGPGTFLPVRVDKTEDHVMHRERYEVPRATTDACARARAVGGRVIAVGTTALRTLEAAWDEDLLAPRPGPGHTSLFCTPGYQFRAVDALFTNFHLPRSTLFMLLAAFAGLDAVKRAYAEAVAQRYRFFSYGDAMLVS